jgi:O-acetyl-ADP-ribose deacetylase (regulator of RNase III)
MTAAVITTAGGKELKLENDNIVHTPPLITQEIQQLALDEEAWACELLLSCYRHSFDMAFGSNNHYRASAQSHWTRRKKSPYERVAVPLLGAGCRDFPIPVAIEAAAQASTSWLSQSTTRGCSGKFLI